MIFLYSEAVISLAPCTLSTVTKFRQFWICLKIIWQLFDGLLSIWEKFEPTLEISLCFWANLPCKWPNFEQIFKASGHTAHAIDDH